MQWQSTHCWTNCSTEFQEDCGHRYRCGSSIIAGRAYRWLVAPCPPSSTLIAYCRYLRGLLQSLHRFWQVHKRVIKRHCGHWQHKYLHGSKVIIDIEAIRREFNLRGFKDYVAGEKWSVHVMTIRQRCLERHEGSTAFLCCVRDWLGKGLSVSS